METQETPPEITDFLDKKVRVTEKPLPKIEDIDSRLVEMADRVAEISGTWNPVEIYTADPDNIKQEQESFFEAFANGEAYNPQFIYSYAKGLDLTQQRGQLMQLLSEVRQLQVSSTNEADRLSSMALYFKIKDDLATCDLVEGIKARDEQKISQALKQKYRGTDPPLIAAAQKEYERRIQADETGGGKIFLLFQILIRFDMKKPKKEPGVLLIE